MPQAQQITNQELAQKLKSQYPDMAKYTDDSVVNAFLAKNPSFRQYVKYDIQAPKGETSIGPPPPLGKRVAAQAADWSPAAAGTVGGIAGSPAGPLAAVAGAGLGGAAGTALQQLIRRIAGIQAPSTSLQAAEEIGKGGAEQALYQGTGEVFAHGVPWAKMFPAGRVAGEEVHAEDIFSMSRQKGMKMTAGEVRGAPKGILRSISELGMLSEKGQQAYATSTAKSAERLADEFLDGLSKPASREQSGAWVKEALSKSNLAFKKEGGQLFAPFRGTPGQSIPLDLKPLQSLANKIEAESLAEIPAQSPAGQLLNTMKEVSAQPGNFDTGMQIRDYLSRFRPGPDQMFADKESEAMASRFWKAISSQMGTDAQKAGGNVAKQWAEARQYWATGRNLFDSKIIKGLVKKDPEVVADSIRPRSVTDIRRIRQILTDYGSPAEKARGQEAWRSLQRGFAERRIIEDPTSKQFTVADLKGLKERLNKLGGEQLREMYGDPQGQQFLRNMRAFAELMSRTDFQSGLGIGKFRVLYDIMGMAGAATAGVSTRSVESGLATFAGLEGGPRVLSAALHSRTATGLLLRTIISPPSSKALATSISQRIIAETVKQLEGEEPKAQEE